MIDKLPERLNLALARGCFVRCRGCYTFFGQSEPDLHAFQRSMRRFVALGLTRVTLSGGDPLTLKGLPFFLCGLRDSGVQSIKLDTVGTIFLDHKEALPNRPTLEELLPLVDVLGLPLDGWSNRSVAMFRKGRPLLFDETIALLDELDRLASPTGVIANTVAHRHNLTGLPHILALLVSRHSLIQWNVFQYTPSDQAAASANLYFTLNDERFFQACEGLRACLALASADGRKTPRVEFRSVASRLGDYLLVNSDGKAWLPDEQGRSIELGSVFDREDAVLAAWRRAVERLEAWKKTIPSWQPSGLPVRLREAC